MLDLLNQIFVIFANPDFYAAAIRLTTPILLAAMGSIFCERAGIMNIASEGWMLIGAMTAVTATYYLGNPWLGLLVAGLVALLAASIFAFFVVRVGTDHIVTGVALNLFSLGLTSLIFRRLFGPMSKALDITGLPTWHIPVLGDLPILGRIFFNQSPLVYLAFLCVPFVHFIMFNTRWGLNVRAAGESPRAVDSVGENLFGIRIGTILIAGLMAGLAGAFLSIGQTTIFQEGMTAGRGYIMYTAIIFGKWLPKGVLVGALIFGAADALQLRIQAIGSILPYQFALMIPYLFTIAAIVITVGKVAWPAAYGQSYRREDRGVE